MSKIHLPSNKSVKWLKQQAKALSKKNSISQSQALHEIAIQQGFPCWKDLIDTFKYESSSNDLKVVINTQHPDYKNLMERYQAGEDLLSLLKGDFKSLVLEQFTMKQKIGAISRKLGVNPRCIKNNIHVAIDINNDGLMSCTEDDWKNVGFIEDDRLSDWIYKNDEYFCEIGFVKFFRVVSLDTDSFSLADDFLSSINEKLSIFFPVYASCVWINGKADPRFLEREYPEELLPSKELPEEIWKRGYQ